MAHSIAKAGMVVLLAAQGALPAIAASGVGETSAGSRQAQEQTPAKRPSVAATKEKAPARPSAEAQPAGATPGRVRPATTGDAAAPRARGQAETMATDKKSRPAASTKAGSDKVNPDSRPNTRRPVSGNNTVVTGNTVVVAGGNRNPNTYPVYRAPNGNYYQQPNGGYYRPPPPPPGGWQGGYYPPPEYYYDDGPSVGEVIGGVAVTAGLLALLVSVTTPDEPKTTVAPGAPPLPAPPPPPPASYVPPPTSTGAPAAIRVDIVSLAPEMRPSASVCLTEAARQIGATGGTEIRIDGDVDVEQGNGGYRFRLNLLGIYPDQARLIPMYCRATPEKIVELTFG